MKLYTAIILGNILFPTSAIAQNDTIYSSKSLKEVMVIGKLIQQETDHYNCIPTNKQRRHSHTGLELVRNMMITGVDVNIEDGKILTPAGPATLYINGREASFREVQGLRPKDVIRVEYYDIPTGKYAKDRAVLNYVVKNYTAGGYTQLEAQQTIGFLRGDYNIISKYSFNNYNANIWAGYKIENPKSDFYSLEHYRLSDEITKQTTYPHQDEKQTVKYFIASLSRMTNKQTWMIRVGIEAKDDRDNAHVGSVQYGSVSGVNMINSSLFSHEKSLKPTVYIYYNRSISKNQSIDAVVDGYYARNNYNRTLTEQSIFRNDVTEDYFYSKLNINYNFLLPKTSSLTFSFHEYLRSSQDNYAGSSPLFQHLRSSETIFFADYNKRWKKAMIDVNPGVSYLMYKLHGNKATKQLAPRLQISASWMPDRIQRLKVFFSLGNTFPSLSSTNRAEQQIDPIMIRRGNPDMDNSTLLGPGLTYSVNYNQWSALFSTYYMYMSNAIVNTYSVEGQHIVNSFSSNARSHQSSTSLSLTWKPSSSFNVKLDGAYSYYAVNREIHERQAGWQVGMQANYYLGDFLFSAFCQSPIKSLDNYQRHVKTPWQYGLTTEWSHNNLSVVLTTNNLFLQKNRITQALFSDSYDASQAIRRDINNAYASIKVLYTLEYGKATRRSPKYNIKNSESTILR